MKSDKAWKRYGEVDPYFGVLTHKRYHSWALTDEVREEFFRSGERHIRSIMKTIREISPEFSPDRTIDFGCGVGRLTIPLARESVSVLGVDVAPGMLAEAQRNAQQSGVLNVSFAEKISGNFNLVVSCMVLQHIPPRRGIRLVRDLVSGVDADGMVVLQIPCSAPRWIRVIARLKHIGLISRPVRNLVSGRGLRYPDHTMYCYDLPSILAVFYDAGFGDIRIARDSAAGPLYHSVTLYGRRSGRTVSIEAGTAYADS